MKLILTLITLYSISLSATHSGGWGNEEPIKPPCTPNLIVDDQQSEDCLIEVKDYNGNTYTVNICKKEILF